MMMIWLVVVVVIVVNLTGGEAEKPGKVEPRVVERQLEDSGDTTQVIAFECEKTLSVVELRQPLTTLAATNGLQTSQIKDCALFDIVKRKDIAEQFRERLRNNHELSFQHVRVNYETLLAINKLCREFSEQQVDSGHFQTGVIEVTNLTANSIFDQMSGMRRMIAPNTRWCGSGDIADSYWDLGPETRIDMCCREHDHCPIRVSGLQSEYGVFNRDKFTASLCPCDRIFYQCLDKIDTLYAAYIKWVYFSLIKVKCLEPSVKCRDEFKRNENKIYRSKLKFRDRACQTQFAISNFQRKRSTSRLRFMLSNE